MELAENQGDGAGKSFLERFVGPLVDPWANMVGSGASAGTNLKSPFWWNGKNRGSDSVGFRGLSGGYRWADGASKSYGVVGPEGHWWTTDDIAGYAEQRGLYNRLSSVEASSYPKTYQYSLRCLLD